MISNSHIPTDEDFARADAMEKKRYRGLDDVSEQIKRAFSAEGVHEIFMFYSKILGKSKLFYARIFYDTDSKMDEATTNGLNDRIRKAVYEDLVAVGRTDATPENIECIFDSHQNVVRDCDGDYLTYLR